jgi:hypothetical protein
MSGPKAAKSRMSLRLCGLQLAAAAFDRVQFELTRAYRAFKISHFRAMEARDAAQARRRLAENGASSVVETGELDDD